MEIFSKPSKTVAEVFEKAVSEVRVIRDAQDLKYTRLSEEQSKREGDLADAILVLENNFKAESAVNTEAKNAADKEIILANKAILRFSEIFGNKDPIPGGVL